MSGQLEFAEDDRSAALRKAWDACLHLLASRVGTVTLDSYIRPARPISWEGNVITLGVASSFAREWIEKKSSNQIRSALEFLLDTQGIELRFVILSQAEREARATNRTIARAQNAKAESLQIPLPLDIDEDEALRARCDTAPQVPPQPLKSRPKSRADEFVLPRMPLNPLCTFENFLEGPTNRFAKMSALAVAENPGQTYNPLFIYGGPGLGKSHLMQAIAFAVQEQHPHLTVVYVTAETFTQQYYQACRDHTTEIFRKQYREADILLVDDIQFVARISKGQTNAEFLNTFNALQLAGRQIVVASDCSPRELHTLDERMRTRLQAGLTVDINPPNIETRIQFLNRTQQRNRMSVPSEVIHYIADAIQSNMRTLEGAMTKLVAYSSIMRAEISLELAQAVLTEYLINKPIRPRRVTIEAIIEVAAKHFETTADVIKGPARNRQHVMARHVAMYLSRELSPETNTTRIGQAFGGRDHSTVLHGCDRIRLLLETDGELREIVSRMRDELNRSGGE